LEEQILAVSRQKPRSALILTWRYFAALRLRVNRVFSTDLVSRQVAKAQRTAKEDTTQLWEILE
jgi:hypothetical protein